MENSEGNHRFGLGPEAAVLLLLQLQRNTRNLLSQEKECDLSNVSPRQGGASTPQHVWVTHGC